MPPSGQDAAVLPLGGACPFLAVRWIHVASGCPVIALRLVRRRPLVRRDVGSSLFGIAPDPDTARVTARAR